MKDMSACLRDEVSFTRRSGARSCLRIPYRSHRSVMRFGALHPSLPQLHTTMNLPSTKRIHNGDRHCQRMRLALKHRRIPYAGLLYRGLTCVITAPTSQTMGRARTAPS